MTWTQLLTSLLLHALMDRLMTSLILPPLFSTWLVEALPSLLCLAIIDSSVALFTSLSCLGSSIFACQEVCLSWAAEKASPRLKARPGLLGSACFIKQFINTSDQIM